MPTATEQHLDYLLQQHYEAECEVEGSTADPSLAPTCRRRAISDEQGFNWDVHGKGGVHESARAIAAVRGDNWQLN